MLRQVKRSASNKLVRPQHTKRPPTEAVSHYPWGNLLHAGAHRRGAAVRVENGESRKSVNAVACPVSGARNSHRSQAGQRQPKQVENYRRFLSKAVNHNDPLTPTFLIAPAPMK